ncbi:glucosamine-6-phosphate deaminase [Paenibacillus ferrarius]|uniref:glucosamine-6-phosphate deaminase n=1 Tax=Paenibacillus ferrarius TaxID=1469647 RepID=UPI003D2730A9
MPNDNFAPVITAKADQLNVQVYPNRSALGRAAGLEAAAYMRALLDTKPGIRMIFAAAPSQNEFLETLIEASGDLDWSRVTVFHMDEYIGLPQDAPQLFSRYVSERLFDRVKPGTIHLIDSGAEPEAECTRYSRLLAESPIDIVCLGIGENGHLAFNDPPVADFNDAALVKSVELDQVCRQQQVNDGCFATLAAVPTHAVTLTIPALMSGARLFCMVPGVRKREAVRHTVDLEQPVSVSCPSTILRQHPACTLYTDVDAYGETR